MAQLIFGTLAGAIATATAFVTGYCLRHDREDCDPEADREAEHR